MGVIDQLRSVFKKPEPATPAAANAAPNPVAAPQERRRRRRVNARNGTRVLVIDDSPTIVAALRKFLRSAGYVVLEAPDAEKGLEIAHAERPDLIFLDIVLPGMNGFNALRVMRRDPRTHAIPVILISGNEQAAEQYYANRIGADDFMKKPFSRYEIFARIETLLDADLVPRRKLPPRQPAAGAPAAAAATPAARPAPSPASPTPPPRPAQSPYTGG